MTSRSGRRRVPVLAGALLMTAHVLAAADAHTASTRMPVSSIGTVLVTVPPTSTTLP